MLVEDRPVLVGLSGGADSVALLGILVRLGYSCIAVHCNFHLRGEESLRDERFAEDFAKHVLGIPFYKTDFDTAEYAAEKHFSIEMAARELRYEWFERMRLELGAQAIAVAHHRDDSVETLLMNLIRGTGIRGLTGIRPKNGFVVRPLLAVSRQEVLQWLAEQSYTYVTDSTNLSDAYTRNFIRLKVLPLLEEINPSVKRSIARTAEHLSAAEVIYLETIRKARREIMTSDHRLSIPLLMRYPAPQTILYELLKPYGVTRLLSDEVFLSLSKGSGKQFYAPDYRLVKDRDHLLVVPRDQKAKTVSYTLEAEEGVWHEPIGLSCRKVVCFSGFQLEKDKRTAYLDYDKLQLPLVLRTWKEGDWFVPFGMKGRKKLSDYFSDHKFSRVQKEQTWLLCSGDDIVWIVGERSDNRFRIDERTKSVLIVNISR